MLNLKSLNSSDLELIQRGLSTLGLYPKDKIDGLYGRKTEEGYRAFRRPPAPVHPKPSTQNQEGNIQVAGLTLSKEGVDKLIYFEVSSRNYFERYLSKPSSPGAASGITVLIGVDLRFTNKNDLNKIFDMCPEIGPSERKALLNVQGKKASRSLANSLSWIKFSWESAVKVFYNYTLPKFSSLTRKTYPGIENLHPNAQAALVSLIYNRGSSLSQSPRRIHMYRIKQHVKNQDYNSIARELRSMKSLWKLKGLKKRREEEAKLVLIDILPPR